MSDELPISFRLLAAGEIPVIRPLWEELNQQHADYLTLFAPEIAQRSFEARLAALRDKSARGSLRIEIAETAAAGPPIAYCVATLSPEGMGEVDSLFVAPEYRRRGIASQLMQGALDWLNAEGASSQRVVVFQANAAALEFYKCFGFHPRNVELERPSPSSL